MDRQRKGAAGPSKGHWIRVQQGRVVAPGCWACSSSLRCEEEAWSEHQFRDTPAHPYTLGWDYTIHHTGYCLQSVQVRESRSRHHSHRSRTVNCTAPAANRLVAARSQERGSELSPLQVWTCRVRGGTHVWTQGKIRDV